MLFAVTVVACLIGSGRAQEPIEPKYASWSKVESADATREYKERIKEAASLDQVSRAFLVQEALPQLAREENRSSIERVRRRMREVLLTEISNPQVLAAANGVVADFMERLARDAAADPVTRVNAAILIGELRGQDGRPWPDAVPRLVGLAKDPKVLIAARVAAVTSLSRFGATLAATPETTAAVGQAVMTILAEQPLAGRPEQDWLAGRAVGLLPTLVPEYSKPVAEQLMKILVDESRSIDVRIRAAAALGARAGAKSAVDAGKAVAVIEALAIKTLADDVEAAEKERFEQQYQQFVGGKVAVQGGGPVGPGGFAGGPGGFPGGPGGFPGGPGGFPGGPGGFPGEGPGGGAAGQGGGSLIPNEIARREAWRLITLAGALDGGDGAMPAAGGKGSLAGVAEGPVAEKAKALGAVLREAALALDADPSEQTLVASLDRLRPTAKKPKQQRPAGDEPAADEPGEKPPRRPGQPLPVDEPAPQPSPFGASPFG